MIRLFSSQKSFFCWCQIKYLKHKNYISDHLPLLWVIIIPVGSFLMLAPVWLKMTVQLGNSVKRTKIRFFSQATEAIWIQWWETKKQFRNTLNIIQSPIRLAHKHDYEQRTCLHCSPLKVLCFSFGQLLFRF